MSILKFEEQHALVKAGMKLLIFWQKEILFLKQVPRHYLLAMQEKYFY